MVTKKKQVGKVPTMKMAHPLGKYATPEDIQQWQLATINSKLDTIIEDLRGIQGSAKKREAES